MVRGMLSIVVACGACYAPTIAPGVACESACPSPQVCIEHVCREPGFMPTDGPVADAPDASPGDQDGDGVANAVDNCPAIANANQHDEDHDSIGDVCDPCPHVPGTALDTDGDGVGDACDPQPTLAKQRLRFFDPFTQVLPAWTLSSGVTVAGDQLRMSGSRDIDLAIPTGELRIATGGTVSSVGVVDHQILIAFSRGATYMHYCEFYDVGSGGQISITQMDGSNYTSLGSASYPGSLPTGAWSMQIDESVAAQRIDFASRLGGITYPLLSGTTAIAPMLTASDHIAFGTGHLDMTVDYFVVIETVP